jgi:hypothetical protein
MIAFTPRQYAERFYNPVAFPTKEKLANAIQSLSQDPYQNIVQAVDEVWADRNVGIKPAIPATQVNEPQEDFWLYDNSSYKQFLANHFEPDDTLGFMFLRHDGSKPTHAFVKQSEALKAEFFVYLQDQNEGASVYVGMNPYTPELIGRASGRTVDNVTAIRNLYADADHDTAQSLKLIAESTEVPNNPTVLQSSPGKYQFIWRVDDMPKNDAKAFLKAIASKFGTDAAVTDVARVLRVPGFKNHKYPELPIVKIAQASDKKFNRTDFKLTVVQEQKPVQDIRENHDLIPHGMIHPWMLRKAGELRNKGLNEEELTPVLLRLVHENCAPPIDDTKVRVMAKSVCRYAPGSDFPVIVGGDIAGMPAQYVSNPGEHRLEFTEDAAVIPEFDPSVINGIYAKLVELMTRGTTLVPQYAYLAAKTYVGLRLAGKVKFATVDAQPRYFGVVIGETGSGKGAAWTRLTQILNSSGAIKGSPGAVKILDGVDSGAGLKDFFFEDPQDEGVLVYVDEAASYANKTTATRNPSALDDLLELVDKWGFRGMVIGDSGRS